MRTKKEALDPDPNGYVEQDIEQPLFDLAEFGKEIIRTMEERGLSYRTAAPYLGLRHYTLHRVATGRHSPDVETYLRIMRWIKRKTDA